MRINGLMMSLCLTQRTSVGCQLRPRTVGFVGAIFTSGLLSILFWLSLAFVLVSGSDESSLTIERKSDSLFHSSTLLHGGLVTCDNASDPDLKFPAETWSCYNMHIDGLRLRSYFIRGLKQNSHCTDDATGKNDLTALCLELLAAHQIKGKLWAALIVKNPPCTTTVDERMMFLKTNTSYEWVRYRSGKGFVHTLRCMLTE